MGAGRGRLAEGENLLKIWCGLVAILIKGISGNRNCAILNAPCFSGAT